MSSRNRQNLALGIVLKDNCALRLPRETITETAMPVGRHAAIIFYCHSRGPQLVR
ncbi:MAG TPA: hypothetical protein VKT29_05550 [Terriglobales bacterium]|nr:hypothetical protein [Terriglobales bacterium]